MNQAFREQCNLTKLSTIRSPSLLTVFCREEWTKEDMGTDLSHGSSVSGEPAPRSTLLASDDGYFPSDQLTMSTALH